MSKALLITGATGKQGGSVSDALCSLDPTGATFTFLAVTRDDSSPAAQRLLAKVPPGQNNLRLVQGDLDEPSELFSAARSALAEPATPGKVEPHRIWGVFSVQPSLGPGVTPGRDIAQGTALVDAAVAARVRHLVYSGVEGVIQVRVARYLGTEQRSPIAVGLPPEAACSPSRKPPF